MLVTAVVPLKALASAKGRLAGALDAEQRRTFVAWMARRVIAACQDCTLVADTIVVAGDRAAAQVAHDAGARVLLVEEPGLGLAMQRADEVTADRQATLVVAADLPHVSPDDLQAVISAADSAPFVVVAPTHDGGTGALLRRPAGVIPTAFGPDSAAAHRRLAREAGVACTVIERQGLAMDIDTPGQLPAALALAAEHDVGCRPR